MCSLGYIVCICAVVALLFVKGWEELPHGTGCYTECLFNLQTVSLSDFQPLNIFMFIWFSTMKAAAIDKIGCCSLILANLAKVN